MNEMEGKEYLTLAEVSKYVGLKRTTLYYYISGLNIKTHKFKFDNRTYMSITDAKRIKEAKEKPWTMEEKKPPAEEAKPTKEAA